MSEPLCITVNTDLRGANDEMVVDALVEELVDTLEAVADELDPTPSEVISASFLLVDKLLRGSRRLSASKAADAAEIRRVLNDLLADFGSVPS